MKKYKEKLKKETINESLEQIRRNHKDLKEAIKCKYCKTRLILLIDNKK